MHMQTRLVSSHPGNWDGMHTQYKFNWQSDDLKRQSGGALHRVGRLIERDWRETARVSNCNCSNCCLHSEQWVSCVHSATFSWRCANDVEMRFTRNYYRWIQLCNIIDIYIVPLSWCTNRPPDHCPTVLHSHCDHWPCAYVNYYHVVVCGTYCWKHCYTNFI